MNLPILRPSPVHQIVRFAARATVAAVIAGPSLLPLGAQPQQTPSVGQSSQHGAPDSVSPIPDFVPWTDSRCGDCHQTDPVFSHAVDILPTMPVPQGFPLDRGRITCTTCHDDSSADLHTLSRQTGDPMLRAPPEALCSQCHQRLSASRQDAHAATQQRAHTRWPDDRQRDERIENTATLDPLSQRCYTCHDGMLAPDPNSHTNTTTRRNALSPEHPVGVEYPPAASTGRFLLRDKDHRDSRIRLFDDNLGCGSCHSLFARTDDLLVVEQAGSHLCLACHDL